jgi:hypothetical protein
MPASTPWPAEPVEAAAIARTGAAFAAMAAALATVPSTDDLALAPIPPDLSPPGDSRPGHRSSAPTRPHR